MRQSVTVIFVLTICVLSALFFYDLGAANREIEGQSGEIRSFLERQQRALIESECRLPDLDSVANCVMEILGQSLEAIHNQKDLIAQQKVAEWTKWVVATGLIQTLLSAAALIWVAKTFAHTSAATRIALESAALARSAYETEHRPWLHFDELNAFRVRVRGSFVRVHLKVGFINYGKTPAKNIRLHAKAYTYPLSAVEMMSAFEAYAQNKGTSAVYTLASNAKLMEETVAVYHLAEHDNADPFAQSEVRYLVVFLGATYSSMMDSDAEYSTTAAMFLKFNEDMKPVVARMGEIDPADFTVERQLKMDRMS